MICLQIKLIRWQVADIDTQDNPNVKQMTLTYILDILAYTIDI